MSITPDYMMCFVYFVNLPKAFFFIWPTLSHAYHSYFPKDYVSLSNFIHCYVFHINIL